VVNKQPHRGVEHTGYICDGTDGICLECGAWVDMLEETSVYNHERSCGRSPDDAGKKRLKYLADARRGNKPR